MKHSTFLKKIENQDIKGIKRYLLQKDSTPEKYSCYCVSKVIELNSSDKQIEIFNLLFNDKRINFSINENIFLLTACQNKNIDIALLLMNKEEVIKELNSKWIEDNLKDEFKNIIKKTYKIKINLSGF